MIFADIRANGFMTERDMKLLKNRSNNEGRDLFDYDLCESINGKYGIPIDEEWANKAHKWLESLLKNNGEPKSGQQLGYREINIIQTAVPSEFAFLGFYDAGRYGFREYIPVYRLGGMEYYVHLGKIQVVG